MIARALAKQPDERYASCGELVEDARRALALDEPRRSRRGIAAALIVAALAAGSRRDRRRRAFELGCAAGPQRFGRPRRSGERSGDCALPPLRAPLRRRRRTAGVGRRLPPGHALAHRSGHRRGHEHPGDRQPPLTRDPRRPRLRRQRRAVAARRQRHALLRPHRRSHRQRHGRRALQRRRRPTGSRTPPAVPTSTA